MPSVGCLNRHLFSRRFALQADVATHARRSEGAAPPEVRYLVCGEREAVESCQRRQPQTLIIAEWDPAFAAVTPHPDTLKKILVSMYLAAK